MRKYSPREYDLLAMMWKHWRGGGRFEKAEPSGWSPATPPEATDLMIANGASDGRSGFDRRITREERFVVDDEGWVYPTMDRSIRITKWW